MGVGPATAAAPHGHHGHHHAVRSHRHRASDLDVNAVVKDAKNLMDELNQAPPLSHNYDGGALSARGEQARFASFSLLHRSCSLLLRYSPLLCRWRWSCS
jgi:hypothetical protein